MTPDVFIERWSGSGAPERTNEGSLAAQALLPFPDAMPHLFFDDRTFRPFEYELEADFEAAVVDHCNETFGAETVYFDIKGAPANRT